MKKYKIYPETTSYYYSILTMVTWVPVFQGNDYFKIIIDSLKFYQTHKGLYVLGYVIRPTHMHLIISNNETNTLSGDLDFCFTID